MRRRMRFRSSLVWGEDVLYVGWVTRMKLSGWRATFGDRATIYHVYIHITPNVYMCIVFQHEKQQQKEWVSPEILPFQYTLQMFVFILVVIPLVTWSRKNCPCIKGCITDLQPFTVLGLTSRCSHSTVVGKDLCGLPSALLSLNYCIWLLLFNKKGNAFRADNKTSTSGTRAHADTNFKFLLYNSKTPRYWSKTQGLGIIVTFYQTYL